jgi:hypothetical protein
MCPRLILLSEYTLPHTSGLLYPLAYMVYTIVYAAIVGRNIIKDKTVLHTFPVLSQQA